MLQVCGVLVRAECALRVPSCARAVQAMHACSIMVLLCCFAHVSRRPAPCACTAVGSRRP